MIDKTRQLTWGSIILTWVMSADEPPALSPQTESLEEAKAWL